MWLEAAGDQTERLLKLPEIENQRECSKKLPVSGQNAFSVKIDKNGTETSKNDGKTDRNEANESKEAIERISNGKLTQKNEKIPEKPSAPKKGRLRFFQTQCLIFWFLIPFIGGAAWFSVCFTVFSMDPMKTEYIRQTVKDYFDLEIDNCAYAGAAFYPLDKNGTKIVSERSFIGFGLFLGVMTIPFIVVLFAGGKSWFIIRALLKQGETRYSKNLQMQLYKALVAQVG
ncbi:hypothetical protein B9Z55_012740 [Caenorhabditis nigoni]|uniref:Uncharacterized protein n=1 Tax=Caenorhabditis nigoni TaxID=1611254 RepID=A0A2G5TYN7_9PELO|nr:hypothetical protein B9Z55_012740 [Caenorhabditis nigoni]